MAVENDQGAPAMAREFEPAPLGGTRAEAAHRLQIGLSGLGVVLLLVAVAGVVMNRARETEAAIVPEAAATIAAEPNAAPANDPLADAGVVPDLPAEPTPTPTQPAPVLPEQGNGALPPPQ